MIASFVMILLGLAGLFLFGLPLLLIGTINMGNATGIVIAMVLLVCGVFRKGVVKLIKGLWKFKAGKLCLGFMTVAMVVIVILAVVETFLIVRAALDRPTNDDVTVVVLGCKVNGTSPSLTLKSRLDAAYEYMCENESAKCVVSGGQGPDEGISEAQCMYNYLVDKGVDKARIYREDKSTTTRENLEFSAKIIESEGLSQEIVIVTNEFHLYRAGKVADSLNLSHKSVPASTLWYLFPTYYVRELWAILYQWVF